MNSLITIVYRNPYISMPKLTVTWIAAVRDNSVDWLDVPSDIALTEAKSATSENDS